MKKIFQFIGRHKILLIDSSVLFGLMVLFFSRWIFLDRYLLFASDIIQDFVTHRYAAFSWSQGKIPLWDPYFFWAAVGYFNSGFFYPFNLLVDLLQIFTYPDFNESYLLMQANIFFHYFLASFFMYLLVRRFVSSRIIAIISAVVFAYSGYMVKSYLHYNYILSAPWLPLFFLFFYKSIFEKKNWFRNAILTGIIFTVSLLPGQTQPGIYFIFLLLIFSAYSAYHFWQTKQEQWRKPFLSLLVVIIVTFGLFAIQFFPTYEYKKYSPRESIEYSYSIGYSVDPLYFVVHSFVPSFWGTMQSKFWDGMSLETLPPNDQSKWLDRFFGGLPNEMTFYLGLLPFFLLPFSVLTKNKFLRNLFLILLFFSVLLMLARSIPLVGRLYWMILGGIARVPARAAILWSFSLSFLTALGLQAIIDLKEQRKELFDRIVKINFLIFIALIIFFFPILLSLLLSQAGKPTMVLFLFPMVNGFSLFLIYFLIYCILIFAFVRLRDKQLPLFFILIFIIVDLFSFHMSNSYILGSPPEQTIGASRYPDINYLKNDKDYFRVDGLRMAAYANNLFSLGYGTTGSYGFAYRPTTELYNIIPSTDSSIYDLLNVKYFYSPTGSLDDFKAYISSSSFTEVHPSYNAFDGDIKTEWIPDPNDSDVWIKVFFREPSEITRIEFLKQGGEVNKKIRKIKILAENDQNQEVSLQPQGDWEVGNIAPIKTQWIKLAMGNFDRSNEEKIGFKEIVFIGSAGKPVEIGSPTLKRISDKLFLNENYFPRAFAVYQYQYFSDRNEMLQAMLRDKDGNEMRQSVFLNTRPLRFKKSGVLPEGESSVKIKNYDLQKVVIEAEMKTDGFLVLSDPWYPGWIVRVDGQPDHIYQAYYSSRAVQLKKGKHEVVFLYQPKSFKLGFIITTITVSLLVAYFVFMLYNVKFRK